MRSIILLLLFISTLFARYEAKPSQTCEAYNNMKHTKNTHHVILDTSKTYTVLKHHKGQNLILVKGEQPAQRWVDDECFSKTSLKEKQILENDSVDAYIQRETPSNKEYVSKKQNILVLSWHNAFCETHRYKKECRRKVFSFGKGVYKEKHFVLHGLWPQPKGKQYCGVSAYEKNLDKHKQWHKLPSLELTPELTKRLEKVMPGYSSNLHKHEWIKHGTCYSRDPNRYYEDSVSLVEQFNASQIGDYFQKNMGKYISLQQLRTLINRSFGKGTGKRVEMKCKKGLLTELWLHLGSDSKELGTLLKRGKSTRSQCYSGRIDKAGF